MMLEIMKSIVELKKLMDLNDIVLIFDYILRNVEFRRFFYKVVVFLLSFIFLEMNKE